MDSLNWDIFSYFFVLFFIYLGYGCAVVVRRRQVRIFVDWFFAGSTPPCAQITKMLIQVILYKEECVMGKVDGKTSFFVSE